MRIKVFTFIFMAVASISVFAFGRGEVETRKVSDPEGFKESIDINDKKTGKYNFLIRAKDKGGNIRIEGPHNIYVDPESDLPIINITNPRKNMRIPGNLNIVGTCVDDDAVGYIELMFNDDETSIVRAEGTEFWSYYLDTAALDDALYSVTAWGVDVNGLKGKPMRIEWNLDRKKPELAVESHRIGALVSGKITLEGTVSDGNGIELLHYSHDEGETYEPVKIKKDKDSPFAQFSLPVDTTSFEDGPAVIWFKATDQQGTEGVHSYLMHVDNTAPEVEVVYPLPEEAVNGIFTVSGYAQDVVGLESLSWAFNGEQGEFDLTVGNPWWVKTFDIRGLKTSSEDLVIRALDVSGNVTEIKHKLPVDQDADLPVVTLANPVEEAVFLGNRIALSGIVDDDDGVESVFYSLDEAEPVETKSTGAFQFYISDVEPGPHSLEIWAKDSTGVIGPRVGVENIVVTGEKPMLELETVATGKGDDAAREYRSGMEIHPESGSRLSLRVNSPSALESISWTIGASAAGEETFSSRGVVGGEYTHEIEFPADAGYGQIAIHITATDIHGRVGVLDDVVKVTDLSVPRGEPGLLFPDSRIQEDGTVVLDPRYPVSGYLCGAIADEARLTKGSSVVQLVQDGNSLRLESGPEAGTIEDVVVEVTTDRGFTYRSRSFTFVNPDPVTAATTPLVRLASVNGSPWTSGMPVEISLDDRKGPEITALVDSTVSVRSAVWTIGGLGEKKGSVKKLEAGSQKISVTLPADLPADRISVQLDVTFKDEAPPLRASGDFFVVRPTDDMEVYDEEGFTWTGTTELEDSTILLDRVHRLAGFYYGRPVEKAEFNRSIDGLALTVEEGRVFLSATKDGKYDNVRISITDVDGWTYTTDAYRFMVDSAEPQVSLVEDIDGIWVQDTVTVQARAQDSNAVTALEYSLDLGKTWNRLASPRDTIDLSAQNDGVIALTIRAIDEADKTGMLTVSIKKDTVPPEAAVIVPVAESRVNGEIRMGIAVHDAGEIIRAMHVDKNGRTTPLEPSSFNTFMIGTLEYPLEEGMSFQFEDASGNSYTLDTFDFIIDQKMDLPVATVNFPQDNEVVTTDFVISGIIYDDDQPARIWYKIDDGEPAPIEAENAYSIPVALSSLTDNEHTVTITPEDVYGVRGEPVTRTFRVSLEEPKASVTDPHYDETSKGIIEMRGVSSDKNDIERVRVSLDNGNSFNDATGTTDWSYRFDSKILKDGTHVVFIKVWDKYGIEGLYSSMINVDNTPPELSLEYPVDGVISTGPVTVSGQAIDSIGVESIELNVRSLNDSRVPTDLASIQLEPDSILKHDLDLSGLDDGLYNVDIWAVDTAGNVSHASRNIRLEKESQRNFIECLYPLDGEFVNGTFNLYGYLGGTDTASSVSLVLNNEAVATVPVTQAGYFRFSLDETVIPEGTNSFTVRSDFGGKEMVTSVPRTINYSASGPWVTVDSLTMGDFAFQRPWLTGRAGYNLTASEQAILNDEEADRDAVKEIQEKLEENEVELVEVSFDNGKTFTDVDLDEQWMYRLETQDMVEGMHYMVIRATLESGDRAVTRMLVQVDKTKPNIRLISPQVGGRYNQEMEFAALANDDIELEDVEYVLRQGDKSAYEVPGFIQGLYFDFHFWGGTFYDIGAGLTFFDDNVKLQVQFGQLTESQWAMLSDEPMRYGGTVIGAKLLANVFYLPFGYLFGPDWAWLSTSLALGANYSYFTKSQSGKPQTLSAVLAQLEFPRVTVNKWKMFRTYALYTEFQLWFVPTDVDTSVVDVDTIIPHFAVGVRVNVF